MGMMQEKKTSPKKKKKRKREKEKKNYKRNKHIYTPERVFVYRHSYEQESSVEVWSLEDMADFGIEFGVEEVVFRFGCTERVSQEGLGSRTIRRIPRNQLVSE